MAANERIGYTAAENVNARKVINAVDSGDVSLFLVDSGASERVCKDIAMFFELFPMMAVVVLGDGVVLRGDQKVHNSSPYCMWAYDPQ